MTTQPRALRTRRALMRAAAVHFDRHGYEGTSLVRVCREAGISMGALTFHFPTKDKLADALVEQGGAATRAAVDAALEGGAEPAPHELRRVRALLLVVARLLESETHVRAAARLTRERPSAGAGWTASWVPPLHELLARAHAQGQLRGEADPRIMTLTASSLIAGVDAHLRYLLHAPGGNENEDCTVVQLARMWDFVIHGAQAQCPSAAGPDTRAGETRRQ
ncbi:TetR family transcriptional regulator [Streptomyces anthocyanicus]